MNNLSSYCGLVDAKIRTSDKDLPVYSEIKPSFYMEQFYRITRIKVMVNFSVPHSFLLVRHRGFKVGCLC